MVASLCRNYHGTVGAELENLNALDPLDPRLAGAGWWHLISKDKVSSNGHQSQSSNQNSITHTEICDTSDHGVPKANGQSSKFLLDLYKKNHSRSRQQESTLNQNES